MPADSAGSGRPSHVGEVLELEVGAPAAGGECVARCEGAVVFLAGALPGERVRAEVVDVRSRLLRARTVEVLDPSPDRIPDRRLAWEMPEVGGVEFAHTTLEASRRLKAAAASDQLARIGGIDREVEVVPAAVDLPADERSEARGPQSRTRVQLAVDADGRLGMLAAASHDVIPLGDAGPVPLAVEEISALGLASLRLPGAARLEIARGADSGAFVVRPAGAGGAAAEAVAAVADLAASLPGEWSVFVGESAEAGSTDRRRPRRSGRGGRSGRSAGARNRGGAAGSSVRLHSGSGAVVERVDGIGREMCVRGDGFWQVHRAAPETLLAEVRRGVGDAASVLDLYCGAGLFAVGLAEEGRRVWGVEGSAAAIADAESNAAGLDAEFSVGRVERAAALPDAEAVVLDPPRAGAGRAVVDALVSSAAERIVYISCDGATFARDAAGLIGGGFALESCRAHDLFPLTGHLEFASVFVR